MRVDQPQQRVKVLAQWVSTVCTAAVQRMSLHVSAGGIAIRYALGTFFKRFALVDSVRLGDDEVYFAADYVEEGYVSSGFEKLFGKYVADSPAVTDTRVVVITKVLADVVVVSESLSLAAAGVRGFSDSPSASDTGLVRMQDYCPYDYFVEDYVGVSRSFT